MSDDELDPLNIGKPETIIAEPIPIPRPRELKASADDSVKLIDDIKPRKRKGRTKSIMSLKLDKEKIFEVKESRRLKPSTSLLYNSKITIARRCEDLLQEKSEDFEPFINRESISLKYSRPTDALKETRIRILERDIETVRKKIKDFNVELNIHLLARAEDDKTLTVLLATIKNLHRQGIEENRKSAILSNIHQRKKMKVHILEETRYRENIRRLNLFVDWMNTLPDKFPLVPTVDVDRFFDTLEEQSEKVKKALNKVLRLERIIKPLAPTKPGSSSDWTINVLHKGSNTGKIIRRFELKVDKLNYSDVFAIVEHLNEDGNHFANFEQLLFDLAWAIRPFPFGIYRPQHLPNLHGLFPAVINQQFLKPEYAFTSFSALASQQWPFRSAVDMMLEMLLLTNPFDIARVFWDVIQETAACMRKVLVVDKGVLPEDVEIDFDSLFPLLEICVFVFGVDEWMTVALYTMSFNEHVSDDPQLQFAMTYLEGLMTQIMSVDVPALRAKAEKMHEQWIDAETDPLGLQSNL